MESNYGSDQRPYGDWPAIDLPRHREALQKAMLEAGRRGAVVRRRFLPSSVAGKVGIALGPVVAVCVAGLLLVTLAGSPLTGQAALANAKKWYSAQEAGGRWEHAVIRIKTHAELFEGTGLYEYDYEQWNDTETGDAKVVISDPRDGKVLETLLAKRDAQISEPYPTYPLHWYRVYSSKPQSEKSYIERRTGDYYIDWGGASLGYPVPTIGVFAPVQTLPSGEFPEGYVMPRECSPLETDATRISLLDGEGKSFVESSRLDVLGEEVIGEPGTRVLVVGGKELRFETLPGELGDPEADESEAGEQDLVFDTRLYFEPDSYAYRGISTTFLNGGEAEWTDSALYRKLEFTDEAPDMSVEGMGEVKAELFETGMWPGFPPSQ